MSAQDERSYRPTLLVGPWDSAVQWEDAGSIPLAMHYATGFLTSPDGDRRWTAMRSTLGGQARKLTVLELGSDGGYGGALVEPDAYTGPLEVECRDGVWGDWRPDGAALFQCVGESFRWEEPDVLKLTGVLLGGPPRLMVPDPEAPYVYTTRWFAMAGRIRGEAVSGLVDFSSVHLSEGQQLISTPYVDAHIAAVEFCNQFEDGTAECGHLLIGRQGYAAMSIRRSTGAALIATEVSATVAKDGGEPAFPATARFRGEGEDWVWQALPTGGRWPMRTDFPDGHRLVEGTVRRVGEDRPARRSAALLEVYLLRV